MPIIIHDAGDEFGPAVLEELLDDLLTMFHQRAWLSISPDISLSALQRHDRRIAAGLDALVLAQHQTLPPLLATLTQGERASGTIAALLLSLQESEPAVEALREAFQTGDDPVRDGLRLGLGTLEQGDRAQLSAGPNASAHVQVATAWLRIQDGVIPDTDDLERWLCDPESAVRTLALRTLSCFPASLRRSPLSSQVAREERLLEALGDGEAPELAEAALLAAAVWRKPWALAWARAQLYADAPYKASASRLLVAASEPADCALLLQARAALGTPLYTDLLASIGNVACGDRLLEIVRSEGALDAALAGRALARMTGVDASTEPRLRVPTPGVSEEDDDFAEEIASTDPVRASAAWSTLRKSLPASARVRGGLDLNLLEGEVSWPVGIDMEARAVERLRSLMQDGGRARDQEHVPWTTAFMRGLS